MDNKYKIIAIKNQPTHPMIALEILSLLPLPLTTHAFHKYQIRNSISISLMNKQRTTTHK